MLAIPPSSLPSVAGSVAGCNFHSLSIPSVDTAVRPSSSTWPGSPSFHPCNAAGGAACTHSLSRSPSLSLFLLIAVQLPNSAIQTCGQLDFQNSWSPSVRFLQVSEHAICHGGRRAAGCRSLVGLTVWSASALSLSLSLLNERYTHVLLNTKCGNVRHRASKHFSERHNRETLIQFGLHYSM